MSKRKKRPMKVAPEDTRVIIPGIGGITISELAEKLKERGVGKGLEEQFTRSLLQSIIDAGGMVQRSQLMKMWKDIKQSLGVRRLGVSLNSLIDTGLLARVKLPGRRPFYSVTEKAMEKFNLKVDHPEST